MASTSDQRTLATSLGALEDAELAALFSARAVPPSAPWRDLFDAAAALLDPASITRGLAALPRDPAAALSRAVREGGAVATEKATLVAAGLVDAEGMPFPAVGAVVRERPPVGAGGAPSPTRADERTVAAGAEVAFTHTASLADILLRAVDAPLVRIASGELAAGDRRALVESGAAPDAAIADILVGIAATVGLLDARERAWSASAAGRSWLDLGTAERWARVAVALRDALPAGLRSASGGWIPVAEWGDAYPWDATWAARAALWRARMIAWALVDREGAPMPWAAGLADGGDADIPALETLLPGEVDRIYLQNDLTAIAPGPLTPRLDLRLRRMARRESHAQASSYRFDADSVSAAISAGESAESLRAFLTGISLTGLPQPLAYVIDRTAVDHGRVRVGRAPSGAGTRITSADPDLLAAIEVDQSLRVLGLARDGDALVSRVSEDAVYWALADARYPAVAVDVAGAPRALHRGALAETPPEPTAREVYADLIERVRAASSDAGEDAWLERELDHAVRSRALVDVVVSLPDGTSRTFRLEATGFGGGRLRGRDRGADVERTLPLTSIVSVHPAG